MFGKGRASGKRFFFLTSNFCPINYFSFNRNIVFRHISKIMKKNNLGVFKNILKNRIYIYGSLDSQVFISNKVKCWMGKMKNTFSTLGCLVYVVMGMVQIAAIVAGFEEWWGWNGFFSIIGASIVGYLPIIGTVIGIGGAICGWGWYPMAAILLFCWPLILYILIAVC